VVIEPRWADNEPDRLPSLVTDLVLRQVAAIVVASPPAARAAQAVTTTIPIVFTIGEDPVKEGIVAGFNRPSGNITGFTNFGNQLFGKRFGILDQIVPKGAPFAFLVNPANANTEPDTKEAQAATNALGRQLRVLTARTDIELDAAFAALTKPRTGGLQVGIDGLFLARRSEITALAARHAVPVIYDRREFLAVGGLMSYGPDRLDTGRQAGVYVARILKGEKLADLPVQQSTKFDFIINLKTAKTLGLDIPPGVLAIANEVIE
jgi:putative ABC transport system substrate-binding protein